MMSIKRTVTLLSIITLLFVGGLPHNAEAAAFTYKKNTVSNEADAKAFCENLPDGVVHFPRNSQNTCYYKAANSSSPCITTNRGGSVNAEGCLSFPLADIIGQNTDALFDITGYPDVTVENLSKKNPDPTVTPEYVENDCEGNIEAGNGSCAILDYLVLAIQVLTSLAGIAIVGSIVYAGIQYSAAGGDSQKVSAAKDRIRNAIIALLFLIFGFAIINYLIPGGALG